jgi:putative DNA methylase
VTGMDKPRLIEFAFPLKQASLDSVHEKNVRHGHISTLHIWPARRPLAACRAALIATLLPDPGDAEKRKELCEKIAGRVVKKIERKKMPNGQTVERIKEETEGGILHWGRETENAETLEWFRQEIKKAYGGRAPKVLDPFAGGGAIPLEAMRLGCEATAVDINPVAWFILKCTLEYPQKLAGQTRLLPEFILHDDAFMAEFFKKAKGYGKAEVKAAIKRLHELLKKKAKWNQKADQQHFNFEQDGDAADELQADLAWHVRAWGHWVLDRARPELARYYPTYADFEPLKKDQVAYEPQPMCLVPLRDDGLADINALNREFTPEYLADNRNPRWVAKPTVACLWARTVICKNCRARVPLLKTCWLSKKASKRTLLTMTPNADKTGVVYGIESNVPTRGGNAAQNREHDRRISAGTMSRAGAECPCCGAIMTMEDIRVEGRNARLDAEPTAIMVAGAATREYRIPTGLERHVANPSEEQLTTVFSGVPFGIPDEPTPAGGGRGAARAFSIQGYGQFTWRTLFTPRQLVALGTLSRVLRELPPAMKSQNYERDWGEAVTAYCAAGFDRLLDRCSTQCQPDPTPAQSGVLHTFHRFALPVVWDFIEGVPIENASGGFLPSLEWAAKVAEHALAATARMPHVDCRRQSAVIAVNTLFDVVVTDPPYYDAIPYSDLMDFFYVWLRRNLHGLSREIDAAFSSPTSPKWDHATNDGELIDDETRHGGDAVKSKAVYEDGMFRAFQACHSVLSPTGRMVLVFANKQPDAWETLVAAIIRAGFVVDGSWPIMTEMGNRMRALAGAALASSVWLACRKRDSTVRPGWDNQVLEEMHKNIAVKLREFWDAGIRGPDFVWAATGPALEAYSKYPVVRKANEPNATMGVGEFLTQVRRMVVDYIVGQVLSGERGADLSAADRLDEVTAYYLLHRHDFGMDDAPVGACILYATACGLSDAELEKTWDVLVSSGKAAEEEENVEDEDREGDDSESEASEGDTSGGSKVKLKQWNQRRGKSLGHEAPQGKAVPLIDRIHRVMHLWKEGDLHKVDEYLDQHALRRHELFKRVVQSLVELSTNSERAILESISNHIGAKGAKREEPKYVPMPFGDE